jgi:hypothetical protein
MGPESGLWSNTTGHRGAEPTSFPPPAPDEGGLDPSHTEQAQTLDKVLIGLFWP